MHHERASQEGRTAVALAAFAARASSKKASNCACETQGKMHASERTSTGRPRVLAMSQLRRIGYLWRSAHQHAHDAPDLSRTYVRQLLAFANWEGMELQPRLLQRVCCKCCTLLIPGLNSTASQRKCPRRPIARRRELRVRCHHCGHTAAFPMAAQPSGRAGLAASSAVPDALATTPAGRGATSGTSQRGGKAARGAAAPSAAGRKSKGREPATDEAAAAVAAAAQGASTEPGGMFGFDFVPL